MTFFPAARLTFSLPQVASVADFLSASGISNFVTGVAAAFWAHSPIVAITPEAGTMTKGHGGFQEVGLGAGQLSMFEHSCKFQADVNNPARIPELTARAFDYALMERGPLHTKNCNLPRKL